jgi:hypothetical protein
MKPKKEKIYMSTLAANGLERGLGRDVKPMDEWAEEFAAFIPVMIKLPDKEEYFPMGKWATIQNIQAQVDEWADNYIKALGRKDDF